MSTKDFTGTLPEDAFVFFMHQGYHFNFFRTSAGDDPPIYRYLEGTDLETFPSTYSHFTDFLLQGVQDHARSIQRWQNARGVAMPEIKSRYRQSRLKWTG